LASGENTKEITDKDWATMDEMDCGMRICYGEKYKHTLFFDIFA